MSGCCMGQAGSQFCGDCSNRNACRDYAYSTKSLSPEEIRKKKEEVERVRELSKKHELEWETAIRETDKQYSSILYDIMYG